VYPKLADRCIDALHKRLNMLQYLVRDSFTILPRIDRDPTTRLTCKILKDRAHPCLQSLLFVALLSIATPRRCHLRCEIEEKGKVRRGKAYIGGATPRQRETFGGGESDAGKGVAVAEDGDTCC